MPAYSDLTRRSRNFAIPDVHGGGGDLADRVKPGALLVVGAAGWGVEDKPLRSLQQEVADARVAVDGHVVEPAVQVTGDGDADVAVGGFGLCSHAYQRDK